MSGLAIHMLLERLVQGSLPVADLNWRKPDATHKLCAAALAAALHAVSATVATAQDAPVAPAAPVQITGDGLDWAGSAFSAPLARRDWPAASITLGPADGLGGGVSVNSNFRCRSAAAPARLEGIHAVVHHGSNAIVRSAQTVSRCA